MSWLFLYLFTYGFSRIFAVFRPAGLCGKAFRRLRRRNEMMFGGLFFDFF
ncbi:MAG: hypothetical protein RL742_1252 [Bacteroidota bacterium]